MQEKEKNGKSHKRSWFQGLQSEFRKIVWTDKEKLTKQTIAVTIITAILCVIVSVFDSVVLGGLNLILR